MKTFSKNITLQQIECLIHLAEEGTFSRAARVMCLTQPSLTKHIQRLEDIVGSTVVERTSGGVELTAEGRVVLELGRRVFRNMNEMEERVSLARNSDRGTISLAASTIPATYILPAVLSNFRADRPDILCFVRMNDSAAVIDMVLDGEVEIGFLGSRPTSKKIDYEALWKDLLVLAIPKNHPWRGRKSVSWDEIAREPFVGREAGSATKETMESYFSERGMRVALTVVAEMGSSESVKEAIMTGLGISVISLHAIRRELERGDLIRVPVEGPPIEREFWLAYRRQFPLKRHHRLFIDFVRAYPLDIE